MNKILVTGCPGAGKSAFSRRLRDMLDIPLYYLDMLWHKPDRTNFTEAEFDTALEDILARDRWIIDGNYIRTMERRMEECDTVFLLDYPVELCLESVRNRIGTVREDMPWIETGLDDEFRKWIEDFPENQLPEIYGMIDRHRAHCDIVIFRSREVAELQMKKMDMLYKRIV